VAQGFIASVSNLTTSELVRVACDSAGSYVLEAFIACEGTVKHKRKFIKKMAGQFGHLATSPGGCHVVEKCFNAAVIPISPGIHLWSTANVSFAEEYDLVPECWEFCRGI
jgi:Pumilio-family RNA binding repeat